MSRERLSEKSDGIFEAIWFRGGRSADEDWHLDEIAMVRYTYSGTFLLLPGGHWLFWDVDETPLCKTCSYPVRVPVDCAVEQIPRFSVPGSLDIG